VLVIAGIFVFILQKVIAARRQPYATGEESMVGTVGTVREPLDPAGMVFVNGALWQATSPAGAIPVGTPVRVVKVDGLHLEVEPVSVREITDLPGPQAASS
jgi:membrane-bound serine protease (ClpP class)